MLRLLLRVQLLRLLWVLLLQRVLLPLLRVLLLGSSEVCMGVWNGLLVWCVQHKKIKNKQTATGGQERKKWHRKGQTGTEREAGSVRQAETENP